MKIVVNHVKNNDINQSKARIRDAVATVNHYMLQNTWTESEYRLDTFCSIRGANTLKSSKVNGAIKNSEQFSFEMVQTQSSYNTDIFR